MFAKSMSIYGSGICLALFFSSCGFNSDFVGSESLQSLRGDLAQKGFASSGSMSVRIALDNNVSLPAASPHTPLFGYLPAKSSGGMLKNSPLESVDDSVDDEFSRSGFMLIGRPIAESIRVPARETKRLDSGRKYADLFGYLPEKNLKVEKQKEVFSATPKKNTEIYAPYNRISKKKNSESQVDYDVSGVISITRKL